MQFNSWCSRRALLRAAAGTGIAAAAGASAFRALALEQIGKTEALYQDRPKGIQRCEICLHFEPPGSCRLVKGEISPQGWCQFFAGKENAQ